MVVIMTILMLMVHHMNQYRAKLILFNILVCFEKEFRWMLIQTVRGFLRGYSIIQFIMFSYKNTHGKFVGNMLIYV